MYEMVTDHWREIKLQSRISKGIKIALSKFRREEEETIIINTILLHMRGLSMLMTCNTTIRLKSFTSGYRKTVKTWSKLKKKKKKRGLGTRMCV